jgi:hypothetical protein
MISQTFQNVCSWCDSVSPIPPPKNPNNDEEENEDDEENDEEQEEDPAVIREPEEQRGTLTSFPACGRLDELGDGDERLI